MKRLLLSVALAASAVGAMSIVAATPASAAGPQPATCIGSIANDGQAAATVQSALGGNGQPGLSAGNHGGVAGFVQTVHFEVCGV
jgi:hypothetical protein